MGSPPFWRYRSTFEPPTIRMSSLPSLSQSMNPTPPLVDSTTYFFSGAPMCEVVSPAFSLTSSNFKVTASSETQGSDSSPSESKILKPRLRVEAMELLGKRGSPGNRAALDHRINHVRGKIFVYVLLPARPGNLHS